MNLTNSIGKIFAYNYSLVCALIAWFVAQALKVLFVFINERRFDPERMIGAGGMPSAHSATVCSLVIAVSKECGIDSPVFAVAVILATVVMYDATGVRRSSGEQAKLLNKIVYVLDIPEIKQTEIKKKLKIFNRNVDNFEDIEEDDEKMKKLKEKLGHTPLEVLGGALLGILVALVIPR